MVQLVTLTLALISVLPAAIVFFIAYGRYDGAFRDNVVFLYFIGGLILGGFLGFLTLLVLSGIAPLIAAIGIAVLIPIALVAAVNRRKWQGERHSVFNGGALGLGAAVMMSLSFLYFLSVTISRQACGAIDIPCEGILTGDQQGGLDAYIKDRAFSFTTLTQAILLAGGLTGILFGLGLLAGDAVRRRKQFRTAFLATAIMLVPAIMLGELTRAWQLGTGGEWLYTVLLAAYGAILGFAAERRLLIQGITEEDRKVRRRRQRTGKPG